MAHENRIHHLINDFSMHSHHGTKFETKPKRINSTSEIQLQILNDELQLKSEKASYVEDIENGRQEKNASQERLTFDVLNILTRRTSDCASQRNSEEPQNREHSTKLPDTKPKKQSFKTKLSKAKKAFCQNEKERETSLRMDVLEVLQRKTEIDAIRKSSDEEKETEVEGSITAKKRTSGVLQNAQSTMRTANHQSKVLLNNLYAEDLIDDLLLFNLLIEHTLQIKKLEKHKLDLIRLVEQKKEEEEEKKKREEAEEERNRNEEFSVNYDVLYDEEYTLWFKRMEARVVKTSHESGRVPGKVGRPTMWKGYHV